MMAEVRGAVGSCGGMRERCCVAGRLRKIEAAALYVSSMVSRAALLRETSRLLEEEERMWGR